MNQQREIIYEYRDRILEGEDMGDTAREQIADVVDRMCGEYMQGDFIDEWDLPELFTQLEQMYPLSYSLDEDIDRNAVERSELVEMLRKDVVDAYDEREEELGNELMRALERFMLLQIIDERWREHLHDMDYLREGIHLRSFAQIDPLVAYKNEGFEMFTGLMNSIWEEFARYVFNVEVQVEGQQQQQQRQGAWTMGGSATSSTGNLSYDGGHAEAGSAAIAAAAGQASAAVAEPEPQEPLLPQPVETRRLDEHERIGRNDPCWCGSGKKFKKCHGA
jgi:preprotein translocase subunit SecA